MKLNKGGRFLKKLISFVTFITVLFSTIIIQAASPFHDMTENTRFFDEMLYLYNESIIQGYSNGHFGPSDVVTRGDAAIMIGRALSYDGKKRESSFSDVSEHMNASGYIEQAVEQGVISGYPDGTFRPYDTVTRGQLAIFLTRAFQYDTHSSTTFSDVSPSMKASDSIARLVGAQITAGYPDGTFRPNEKVTRSQFSAFLARSLNDDFITVIEQPTKQGLATFHFIDVGQGDATLIETPSKKVILIDGGIQKEGKNVANYIRSLGYDALDQVIATHPHADHIGGLQTIVEEFPIKEWIDSGKPHTSQTYLRLLRTIDEKDIPFRIAQTGDQWSFDDGMTFKVLYANPNAKTINDASIVVQATYGDIQTLLTGDAERPAEQQLVEQYGTHLRSDILKAGHHGSQTSSIEPFIRLVQPKVAILSYGKDNKYGHPHREVVERFERYGTKLYHTAIHGTIRLQASEAIYNIETEYAS